MAAPGVVTGIIPAYVKDKATGDWYQLLGGASPGATGEIGPTGPTGPPGTSGMGLVGQLMGATGESIVVPTANTFTTIKTGDIYVDTTRMYQIYAGIRCCSDAGASCNGNITLKTGSNVGIFDDYFTTSGAEVSLWGAWCQQMVQPGTFFTATSGLVTFTLQIKFSVANITAYLPRITLIDVGPVV